MYISALTGGGQCQWGWDGHWAALPAVYRGWLRGHSSSVSGGGRFTEQPFQLCTEGGYVVIHPVSVGVGRSLSSPSSCVQRVATWSFIQCQWGWDGHWAALPAVYRGWLRGPSSSEAGRRQHAAPPPAALPAAVTAASACKTRQTAQHAHGLSIVSIYQSLFCTLQLDYAVEVVIKCF